MILKMFAAALFAATSILCCSCRQQQEEGATNSYTLRGDTLILAAHSPLKAKLKTLVVQEAPYSRELTTAGIVKVIPTQYAEIAPPFKGRVSRVYLQLGMKTDVETPLFEISSPDFIEAQKVFFQEKTQLQQAEKTLKREQDLAANGVGTQKDLEEAQTSYVIARKEYENTAIGIRIFKADPARLSMGQALVVRSPLKGEVIENKIVLGQFIGDDAAPVATVASLSRIWIAGQVKEKDIRFIQKSDGCHIEVPALPGKQITGKVYHINEIVNEASRSVEVLIEADNTDRALKPGMYVTVHFAAVPATAILIPAKAILQREEQSFVFVETTPGRYIRRNVILAGTQGDKAVVQSGLKPSEHIVGEGGFYLLDAR